VKQKMKRFASFSSSPKCATCDRSVYANDPQIVLDGLSYHRACAKCTECKCQITIENFTKSGTTLYCKTHYIKKFKEEGTILGSEKFTHQSAPGKFAGSGFTIPGAESTASPEGPSSSAAAAPEVISKPTPEPVSEPVPEPISEPEPVPEPPVAPVAEPIPEPVVEPDASEPVAEPVVEPVVEPAASEPVVEPAATEPVVEPAVEPGASEPVVEPASEPSSEPVAAPDSAGDVTVSEDDVKLEEAKEPAPEATEPQESTSESDGKDSAQVNDATQEEEESGSV
jgi:hypothetical protein